MEKNGSENIQLLENGDTKNLDKFNEKYIFKISKRTNGNNGDLSKVEGSLQLVKNVGK